MHQGQAHQGRQDQGKDLKDGAVENDKIADGAVDGAKIEDGSVSEMDIADGAVSSMKLGSDVTALGLSGIASVPAGAFVATEVDRDYSNESGWAIENTGLGDGTLCVTAPVPPPPWCRGEQDGSGRRR